MKSRSDIDALIDQLRARLQALLDAHPHDAVLDLFADEAKPLVEQVPAEFDADVQDRVHRMLVDAGLLPDESPTG
ncbi:hypothetical protein CMZ84_05975 [Lysobacteraceae bacterium NML93-0399]|nr:hypothetical protein CMZ84_05975 [Xanthomonadaceae bacterium NML93-0399]